MSAKRLREADVNKSMSKDTIMRYGQDRSAGDSSARKNGRPSMSSTQNNIRVPQNPHRNGDMNSKSQFVQSGPADSSAVHTVLASDEKWLQ